MKHWAKFFLLSAIVLGLAGCMVGPNYKRPAVTVPDAYRAAPEISATTPDKSASLSDQKWEEVFQDKQLQELIRTALRQNYDVRIAAARILEAQAQLGITRADQFPAVDVGGSIVNQQSAASGPINQAFETNANSMGSSFAWE